MLELPAIKMNPESLLRLFDAVPEVYFFAKDRDGRFLAANEPLRTALGLPLLSQWLGRTDFDLFAFQLAIAYREEDRQAMAGETVRNRIWHVPDRHGNLHWYLSSKFPLRDPAGDICGVAGIMRDARHAGMILAPYRNFEPAIRMMHDSYALPLRVAELAAAVHLSVSAFERGFHRLFAITPLQYLTQVRIDAACDLLIRSDRSISDIAFATGFYDQSHFAKRFKKACGLPPQNYRRQMRHELSHVPKSDKE